MNEQKIVQKVRIVIIVVAVLCILNALFMQRASSLIVSNAKSCDLTTQGMGEYDIFYRYFNDGSFTKDEGTQALRLSISYVKSAEYVEIARARIEYANQQIGEVEK